MVPGALTLLSRNVLLGGFGAVATGRSCLLRSCFHTFIHGICSFHMSCNQCRVTAWPCSWAGGTWVSMGWVRTANRGLQICGQSG